MGDGDGDVDVVVVLFDVEGFGAGLGLAVGPWEVCAGHGVGKVGEVAGVGDDEAGGGGDFLGGFEGLLLDVCDGGLALRAHEPADVALVGLELVGGGLDAGGVWPGGCASVCGRRMDGGEGPRCLFT